MKKKYLLGCITLLIGVSHNLCIASNRPGAITYSFSDAYYRLAPKRKIDSMYYLPNVAITYNVNCQWAIEGSIGVINTNTTNGNATPKEGVHGYLYLADGIYRLPSYQRFEPYLSAGIGLLGLKPNGTDSEYQGNINAGIGAQIFASHSIAFRAEARDLYTITGGKNDYMINLGLSFLFDSVCCKSVC